MGCWFTVMKWTQTLWLGFAPWRSFSPEGQSIASCLREVKLYLLSFILKLNVSKTQLLICGQKNTLELFSPSFVQLEASLNLMGYRVHQGNNLITVFEQTLKFDDIMNEECSSGFYELEKLKNLRTTLEVEDKLTLVKGLMLGINYFCSFLCCACEQKKIKKLEKLLNTSIRLLIDLRRSVSVSSCMEKCHILPVRWIIKYKLLFYLFAIFRGAAPEYLSELFHRHLLDESLYGLTLNKLVQMLSQQFSLCIKRIQQHIKNWGKSNNGKFFFLLYTQDGRYYQKFTLCQQTLSSVFTIVEFGFKASFPWSDYWFK